jgi:hypothetical protein
MSLTAVAVGIENGVVMCKYIWHYYGKYIAVYKNSIRNSFIKGLRTFLAYSKVMIHGNKN